MKSRHRKRLPEWVMTLPAYKQRAVLIGYLLGDGHYGKSGVRCNTVSPTLAMQVYEISLRLGLPASLSVIPKKEGRVQYGIEWSRASSEIIVNWTPEELIVGKTVRWEGKSKYADQTHVRLVEGDLVGRVRSVIRIPGGMVYNLSVEEDESYVANGTVVHNCTSYAGMIILKGAMARARGILIASGEGEEEETPEDGKDGDGPKPLEKPRQTIEEKMKDEYGIDWGDDDDEW